MLSPEAEAIKLHMGGRGGKAIYFLGERARVGGGGDDDDDTDTTHTIC